MGCHWQRCCSSRPPTPCGSNHHFAPYLMTLCHHALAQVPSASTIVCILDFSGHEEWSYPVHTFKRTKWRHTKKYHWLVCRPGCDWSAQSHMILTCASHMHHGVLELLAVPVTNHCACRHLLACVTCVSPQLLSTGWLMRSRGPFPIVSALHLSLFACNEGTDYTDKLDVWQS